MKIYHLSGRPNIKRFWPMTHFGTKKAAQDVASSSFKTFRRIFLYECDLIGNPAITQISDYGNTPRGLLIKLADDKISFPGMTQERKISKIDQIIEKEEQLQDRFKFCQFNEYGNVVRLHSRKYVSRELQRHGFQVFSYENATEDAGKISYLVLDNKYVRIGSIIELDRSTYKIYIPNKFKI